MRPEAFIKCAWPLRVAPSTATWRARAHSLAPRPEPPSSDLCAATAMRRCAILGPNGPVCAWGGRGQKASTSLRQRRRAVHGSRSTMQTDSGIFSERARVVGSTGAAEGERLSLSPSSLFFFSKEIKSIVDREPVDRPTSLGGPRVHGPRCKQTREFFQREREWWARREPQKASAFPSLLLHSFFFPKEIKSIVDREPWTALRREWWARREPQKASAFPSLPLSFFSFFPNSIKINRGP